MKQEINQLVKTLLPRLKDIRRHLHQFPEKGREEFKTTDYICEILSGAGLNPVRFKTITGCYVDIGGAKGKNRIALRADIDALPLSDQKNVLYASKIPGRMHACGHDFHTAAALGTALVLAGFSNNLLDGLRIIFQPAEEVTPGGSLELLNEGVLKGVGAITGFHSNCSMSPGKIAVKEGFMNSSTDTFRIKIHGRGAHSSRPHEAIDPVYIAGRVLQFIYSGLIIQSDPRLPNTASVCEIHGGTGINLIPDTCELSGTARAQHLDVRKANKEKLRDFLDGMEKAFGAVIDLDYAFGASAVNNNPEYTAIFKQFFLNNFSQDNILEAEVTMGGEDFGNFSELIPALFIRIGTGGRPEFEQPAHTSLFDVNDEAIAPAVEILSLFLLSTSLKEILEKK